MKKIMINEHDMTKKMMGVIRGELLKENTSNEGDDVITPAENDNEYVSELKKFGDTIDPRVQITKFKIYPNDKNVEFEGRLDIGINFFMSIKALKLSISITDENGKAQRIYVDELIISTLQKLDGYYKNWSNEWAKKLQTEYKPK
jgi:hypothetical protein